MMKINKLNRSNLSNDYKNRIFAATSFLALLTAGVANAQTAAPAPADTPIEEIVVTGTQIRGVAPVGAPVIGVDQDEIIQSGANNTSDVLHEIPQVTSIGAGQNTLGANQNANLNTNKANAINIRGLGDQATLTLLDGRRVPPGGPGAQLFDPSSIPTIALSNIDVVTDGASATYGSDAVAGVANLVLRKNFEGADVDARFGTADNYENRKLDAIIGHKWDGGSLMIAGEVNTNNQLTEGKRIQYFNCNETAFGGGNNCSKFAAPGNITVPAGATIAAGTYGIPAGGGTTVTASQLGAINYFNQALDTTLIPKTNRKSLVANFQQKVADSVNLWVEGYYTDDHVSYDSGQYQISGSVPSTSPYFIPLGAGITKETVNVAGDPYGGPAVRAGFEHNYQAAGGADIDLFRDWQLNAYYEHSGNDLLNRYQALNTNAEATALACTTPGICFDPFGAAPGNAAAFSSFLGTSSNTNAFVSDLVNAKIDGTAFELPGGSVKFALGGEIHHDSFSGYNYGSTNGATVGITSITTNTEASRTVDSVFAEAIVPVVGANNSMPFVKRLDIDLAGRYDKYSDVGSTLNPKYAVRWKPADDLTFNASYGTSFRAPTLCDTNPNCSAAVLSGPGSPGTPVNTFTIVGGNSSVKPETAKTYSFGGDYKPSWLKGLSLSANYYFIDYNNYISTPGQGNPAVFVPGPVNPLYASFVNYNPTLAQITSRIVSQPFFTGSSLITGYSANGQPILLSNGYPYAIVDGTRHNVGAIHTNGLDLAANYYWSSGWGDWDVGATATYTFEYRYDLLPGTPYIDRLNQANYPTQFRGRAKFGWSNDDFNATAYVNYTGSYNVVQLVTLSSGPQNQKVDSYTTVDGSLVYKLNTPSWGGGYANGIMLSLSVQNLLDAKPPYALVSTTYQFDSQSASALGRLVTFGIRKSF